jgi:hypothetical protein
MINLTDATPVPAVSATKLLTAAMAGRAAAQQLTGAVLDAQVPTMGIHAH